MRDEIQKTMPTMLLHEGAWEGEYQTLDLQGTVIDRHRATVHCVFPEDGPFAYWQKSHFVWDDGREFKTEFGGELRGDKLYWDTDRFQGFGWATHDDAIMLRLDRKDESGVSFTEVILIGEDRNQRARTWHWFRDGKLYQRTLCNESLIR